MARVTVNSRAADALRTSPEIKRLIRERLAEAVLDDAKSNLRQMGAVDSGDLLDSGEVTPSGDGFRVGFTAPYASIVHEGSGYGRNAGPRPFLANSAFRDRGTIQ